MTTHASTKSLKQRGMTLIEVMIALVILSVGVLALGALQLNAIQANASARRLTEATRVMTDEIERLMGATWSQKETDTSLLAGGHTWKISNTPFTLKWQVQDSAAPLLKKTIELTVTWEEKQKEHKVAQTIVRTMD